MSDYIQIAAIRGTPNRSKNPYPMLLNDFYTLCLKNPYDNIGLRKKSKYRRDEIIFNFNDIDVKYLCSDFVRFCLALCKDNSNLISSKPLSMIPKEPIPISDELKQYIEDFIPDFYGIRK
jgi:hypothetical protein